MKASIRGVCLGMVGLLAVGLAPAAAEAATYYARGGGGNTKASCNQGDECNLTKAVKEAEKSGPGSAVVLVSGPNFTPGEVVTVEGAIDIGGTPGAVRPTIVVPSGEGGMALLQDARLHDANLIAGGGNYALDVSASSVERVFVESTTGGTVACNLFNGTMTDSTCLARESSGVFMGGSTASYTARLRNVDAIGKIDGIQIFGPIPAGDENLLEATNTIAVGLEFGDVNVNSSGGGARVLLSRSDYDSTTFIGSSKNLEITPPGTNGSLTAPPLFANEAGGDLHQLPTSPTVDAGLTEDTNGPLDLDGNPRALTAHPNPCAPLTGPTDIGAYEFVASVPLCPAASSGDHGNAPPPAPAPLPGTTLKLAKIDSDEGTAKFTFAGTGPVSGFACELVRPAPQGVKTTRRRKPKFAPCRSPKTYKHLAPGKYAFRVEALGAGGTDPTPALRKFRIRP
jgi:hypothetical protein